MKNVWVVLGAVSGFISVAMGAFGAHALSQRLSEKALATFQTAANYQMVHSLALIGLGLWVMRAGAKLKFATVAGWSFSLGILLFSGSLYALSLTGLRPFAFITPVGGLLFLLGWSMFAVSAR